VRKEIWERPGEDGGRRLHRTSSAQSGGEELATIYLSRSGVTGCLGTTTPGTPWYLLLCSAGHFATRLQGVNTQVSGILEECLS
jgi:hypothetical protein